MVLFDLFPFFLSFCFFLSFFFLEKKQGKDRVVVCSQVGASLLKLAPHGVGRLRAGLCGVRRARGLGWCRLVPLSFGGWVGGGVLALLVVTPLVVAAITVIVTNSAIVIVFVIMVIGLVVVIIIIVVGLDNSLLRLLAGRVPLATRFCPVRANLSNDPQIKN